jgi:hypothetical protein
MIALAALILALQATPAPSPSATPVGAAPVPSPLPTDNPAIGKLAREQFYAFVAGKVDPSQYSISIPTQAMPQARAFLSSLGPVVNVTLVQSTKMDDSDVYVYKFTCQNGAALEQISIKNGKIDGIYFRPVQQ